MKYLIPALVLGLALLSGCDRFEHNFEPVAQADFNAELFTPLDTAFDAATVNDLSPVMAYFAEDYLHFGQFKADRLLWLESIYNVEPDPVVEVFLQNAQQQSDSTGVANWRLTISTATKTVLADSTFIGEKLVKRNGLWLLRGNQQSCQVPTPKQRVILEYFTFLGCPNCPPVEAKLHELQQLYPDQLSYLEYHTSAPLQIPGDNTFSYYGLPSVPATVFQGETALVGSTTDILDAYAPLVQSLGQMEGQLGYSNLVYTLSGNTITGSITVEPLSDGFSATDMVLSYVLLDRVSTYTNTIGEHLRNVVRAKGSKALSLTDLDHPISFTLQSSVEIPDDASLVLFVQSKPAAFANDATIHSGIEVQINTSK